MQKKLLVLFLLLSIFVNLKSVKEEVTAILSKSFYFPFLYSRNLILLLSQEERRSIELTVENQKLREMLLKSDTSAIQIADTGKFYVGEILQYIPLGIPEILVVKIKSSKIEDLTEGTVVNLNGFLVGVIESQEGKQLTVKTIYNDNFKVGVECLRPYYTGVLRGGEIPYVFYVPVDANIKIGDTLFTSRLSSYAKPYIPVGIVKEYQRDMDNPIFFRAKIEPFFKPFTSRTVIVYGKPKA
jgi:cell shape-determining protein MreC